MSWFMLVLLIMGQSLTSPPQSSTVENYLMGRPDSPIKIEMFSDFQCPSCRAFYLDTVTRLLDEYSSGNKVAVIFHDFPLSIHASSRIAARYSLASKVLGRDQYLNVIKYLYTCQAEWSWDGNIEKVLSRILSRGDMEKVKEKLKDPTIEQTLDREVALGNSRKVSSTPTLFVTMGGKEQTVSGGLSYVVLKDFIAPNLRGSN
ncbi:MAG TPA: thioredoxin domain-containing protein [Acidobacteriota bacterium]|nr:thioredoxin domain-containing protein [Acidobacteriota bacterium]